MYLQDREVESYFKPVFPLTFFTNLQNPNLEKIYFYSNSIVIFTCPNPALLVPGFGQVGEQGL